MPSAEIAGPKINDIDLKRQLVKEVTDSMMKAYKIPTPSSYIVTLIETQAENVAVGGELIADRKK